MNVLSWNVRGLGSDVRGPWLRKLKAEKEIGALFIQDTQFESLDTVELSRLCGRTVVDYAYVDAPGRSGGLITMWNPKVFSMCAVTKTRNVLVVSRMLKGDGRKLTLIN